MCGKIGKIPLCPLLLVEAFEYLPGHPRGDLQAESGPVRRVVVYAPIQSRRCVSMGCPGIHGVAADGAVRPVVAYASIRRRRCICMACPGSRGITTLGRARGVVVYAPIWRRRCKDMGLPE